MPRDFALEADELNLRFPPYTPPSHCRVTAAVSEEQQNYCSGFMLVLGAFST